MKNLSRLMFVLLLVLGFNNGNAQDDNNPWQVTVGVNAVDVYPVGENAPQGEYFDEFYNVNDHWNIVPVLSTIIASSLIAGTYAPPAVQEPITAESCGIPSALIFA